MTTSGESVILGIMVLVDAAHSPLAPPRAVIASGAGRYADPWHPFAATSARLAEALRADGWEVAVDDDVDRALAHLSGADLLVVNAGDPWRDGSHELEHRADPAADAGLRAAIARGIGIVAVHAALSTLRDHPAWRAAIGGEWVPGRSRHPPLGDARVRVTDPAHPITARMPGLDLVDERYADLAVDAGAHVLAMHDVDGADHPAVWVREEPARVVVSTLGHDERAYDCADLVTLLQRAARWAARA